LLGPSPAPTTSQYPRRKRLPLPGQTAPVHNSLGESVHDCLLWTMGSNSVAIVKSKSGPDCGAIMLSEQTLTGHYYGRLSETIVEGVRVTVKREEWQPH
jgi:hypothetical protein